MIVFLLAFVFLTVSVLAVAYLAVRFSQLFLLSPITFYVIMANNPLFK